MVSTSDFPQADRLEQVGLVAEAIHNGHETDSAIENYIGLNSYGRQGRYYRLAAEILGLIKNEHNQAYLTPLGNEYAKINTAEARIDFLARCLVETTVFKNALGYIHQHNPTNPQLRAWFLKFYPGAHSTASRRFSTFQNYLEVTDLIRQVNGKNEVIKYVGGVIRQTSQDNLSLLGKQVQPNKTRPPKVGNLNRMTFNVDMQKMERANQIHWKLVNAKSSFLDQLGLESFENKHIDLFTKIDGEAILYEMKSINPQRTNTISQIRKAISQLYEYRYIFSEPQARLCIVTNEKLKGSDAWISDYLSEDRLIAYEWTEDFVNFSCEAASKLLLNSFTP